MTDNPIYATQCAYTIKHSRTLQQLHNCSTARHTFDTKQQPWATIQHLLNDERQAGRIVPVLFARAEQTDKVVAMADLVSVKTGASNSFCFTNFRYLDQPIRKETLKLANGRKLSRHFIRPYAICMTPKHLMQCTSRRTDNGVDDIQRVPTDPGRDKTTRTPTVSEPISGATMYHVTVLTDRFDRALLYATHVHGGQVRKETSIPYIAHLLAVSATVLEYGGDEDLAIAALLHDSVEDQGGKARLEDVRNRFGKRVAHVVAACSDSQVDAGKGEQKPDWRTRKKAYIAHLGTADDDVLRVSLADKVHNARAILRDLARQFPDNPLYSQELERIH